MSPGSELLHVAGGHVLRRVGVSLDVALGAVPETPLQLVGVLTRLLRQPVGEGMPQIVRSQG